MTTAATAVAAIDPRQYADDLRKSLLTDLFDGNTEEQQDALEGDDQYEFETEKGGVALSLANLESDIDEFAEHEIIKEILEQGRVLKEYTRDVDEKLRGTELESIQDYIQESDNLVELHDQIKSCDDILAHMEQLLGKFQGDLGKVSEEIRQLQVQSQTMSLKLKNRRAAENKLGSFIEQVALTEDLADAIMDLEVNEDFVEPLLALDKKLSYISDDDIAKTSMAKRDVEPALDRLRIKALQKVREFLLSKIYGLKKPKTNIQIIQQNVLLKYKYFVRFLRSHGDDVYDEVRGEYIGVVSRIYAMHFKSYLASMEKMKMQTASAGDLIGSSEGPSGVQMLAIFQKLPSRRHAETEAVFELGERGEILRQIEQAHIIPHMAEYENKKFPYEVIFRNVHKLLMDTATSEYFFTCDFFEDESVFRELFKSVTEVVEQDLEGVVQEMHDTNAMMLMIRINHEHRRMMMRRKVPALDDYLDRLHLLLWPRLKQLFDNHLASVKAATEKLVPHDAGVHFVVRRYAALVASIWSLLSQNDDDDNSNSLFKAQGIHDMMERLWATIFDMLLRMSNTFKDRRQGIIFLIVNYNHIIMVLREKNSHQPLVPAPQPGEQQQQQQQQQPGGGGLGKFGAMAIKECEDQLASCTNLYVDDQLHMHFRDLVEFVKKAEQGAKRAGVGEGEVVPGFGPAQAAPLCRQFAATWQKSIDAMHKEVTKHFADAQCGREVLQASMTQMLVWYTRLLDLVKKQGPEGVALAKESVNVPSIMYEIKRITKS